MVNREEVCSNKRQRDTELERQGQVFRVTSSMGPSGAAAVTVTQMCKLIRSCLQTVSMAQSRADWHVSRNSTLINLLYSAIFHESESACNVSKIQEYKFQEWTPFKYPHAYVEELEFAFWSMQVDCSTMSLWACPVFTASAAAAAVDRNRNKADCD